MKANTNMDEIIVKELMRRYDILLANASPGEIDTGMSGSRIWFRAALCLIGYPFQNPPAWMDDEYLKPLMDTATFESDLYDSLINGLHSQAFQKINNEEL